jgi:anthranilate 1,2-dioxygenase small subunit
MDSYRLITQMQAEYARCIDNDRLEDWPRFFEPDCLYRITTADNYQQGNEASIIYADSLGMLQDRVSALREANIYEQHRYRHILGAPVILSEDGNEINSETPFLVVRIMRDGTTDLFASGVYLDRCRLTGGRASLVRRIVVCDSSRIDTLLALPL